MDNSLKAALIIAAGLLVSAAAGVGIHFMAIAPKLEANAKSTQRIERKTQQLERAKRNIANWNEDAEDLELEFRQSEEALEALREKNNETAKSPTGGVGAASLPTSERAGSLEAQIKLLGNAFDIGVKDLRTEAPSRDGRLSFIPYRLTVTGTFTQLLSWIQEVTLEDGRACEFRTFKLNRLKQNFSPFAALPRGERMRLELSGLLLCAGTTPKGAFPRIDIPPQIEDSAFTTQRAQFVTRLFQESTHPPFTPALYLKLESDETRIAAEKAAAAKLAAERAAAEKAAAEENSNANSAQPESPSTAAAGTTAEGKVEEDAPTTKTAKPELIAAPARRYVVLAVLMKDNAPIALIMPPDGSAKAVREGDRLGTEGGKVASIGQSGVVIEMPSGAAVVRLSVQAE